MKRILACAAMLGGLMAISQDAQAQARMPAVELGFYGGGAWSSDWVSVNEDAVGGADIDGGARIGWAPVFGAHATYNLNPAFGVRVHGAYMPSEFPEFHGDLEGDGPAFLDDDSGYPLNNWFYDLNLVFRPFISRGSGTLASTYLFVGGGGLTTNVAGQGDVLDGDGAVDCVDGFANACLAYQPEYATVGQGTVGIGVDAIPLPFGAGLFLEGAVHGYDSPFHVDDDGILEDKFAWTPRLAAGIKFAFGDRSPEVVRLEVPPAPAPAPPPARPVERAINVCVIDDGDLRSVQALFLPAEGDTLVVVDGQRRPFASTYPSTAPNYAASTNWYLNNSPVMFEGKEYVRYGVTRIVNASQLEKDGDFMGTPVFVEAGAEGPHSVIYLPVHSGCEFQAYQLRQEMRPRG